MQVSQKVLNNVALYIQWREAQTRANAIEDQLTASTPYMTRNEAQSYEHIVGLYELDHSQAMPQQPTQQLPLTEAAIADLGER